jgi:carbamoyl-phosphate synthase large subunit
VAKATGVPLPYVAARCMFGETLAAQGANVERRPRNYAVKEAVFPFIKFPGVDPLLGPEMKSTGEVMGIGASFGEAFSKAQQGANMELPRSGTAFVSVRDGDKPAAVALARRLLECGFRLVATRGTAACLNEAGVECQRVNKVVEGQPHIVDMIKNDEIDLIINTTEGKQAIADSYPIRTSALNHRVAYTTTMAGATAAVMALAESGTETIRRLQDLHKECAG